MAIPVYVVTGFLCAGKTTFLNSMLNQVGRGEVKTLLIQFEAGEEDFNRRLRNCRVEEFSIKELKEQSKQVAKSIYDSIKKWEPDEIWVEWNGMTKLLLLQELLSSSSLQGCCKIQRVIHIADNIQLDGMLGRTGEALPEQITNSDAIILRVSMNNINVSEIYKQTCRTIKSLNKGVPIYKLTDQRFEKVNRKILERRGPQFSSFFLVLLMFTALFFLLIPGLNQTSFSLNTVTNVFLGIILQAIPFLLLGVLLSSLLQIFVPETWIDKLFHQSLVRGMLAALIGGFCLPVCDCVSIPVFRSMVRKGVGIPAAVTFMLAAPVINPVVILSTWYAFNGQPSVVIQRVLLGGTAAIIIGLSFAIFPPKKAVLAAGRADTILCGCGYCQDQDSVTSLKGKIRLLIWHGQKEFFEVAKYLMIGSFITAVFQASGIGSALNLQRGNGAVISTMLLMGAAFILSLCSSSDAVIARSLSGQFPMMSIMGFLIFGPMMDIKNVLLLSAGFSKRFILRLIFTTVIVCFVMVFLYNQIGGR